MRSIPLSSVILAAALLSGCQTVAPKVETVSVRVPVPVPCIAAADVPHRPAPLTRPLPDDADALLSLALAQLKRFGLYADRVDAVLPGCTKP